MDPTLAALITILKDAKSAHSGLALVRKTLTSKTEAFLAAWDSLREDWFVEVVRALHAQSEHLQKHDADLERVHALLSDHQFKRVFDNYVWEAAREALDERRRMLACAFAGSVEPELTIAQIARVERVIRELDPEDVVELGAIMSAAPDTRFARWSRSSRADALVSSGCLRSAQVPVWGGARGEIYLTSDGAVVLRVLRGYVELRRDGASPSQETTA